MHSHSYEAIVLKTYDVGEADRFCIVFTKELGRVAVRARSARRLKSRIGSALLPLSHIRMECKEFGTSLLMTSAMRIEDAPTFRDIPSFLRAEQGMELLLVLLEDSEPLPQLFETSLEFLRVSERGIDALLPYTLRTLHLLGHLPESGNTETFSNLSDEERSFVRSCASGAPLSNVLLTSDRLQRHCQVFLSSIITHPLKTPSVVASMM